MNQYQIRRCTREDATTIARHRVEMFREMGDVPTDDLAKELLEKSIRALATALAWFVPKREC